MSNIQTASEVDRNDLRAFLAKVYSASKSNFLHDYGKWWHGGDENRWVLTVGDSIAGYCAVIPSRIIAGGEIVQAIWWVDLIIDLEFRGKGYQRLFDEKIRNMGEVKLGFPNALAAKIHRKHGWMVNEDLKVCLMPLIPSSLKFVGELMGIRGFFVRLAMKILNPIAFLWRKHIKKYHPRWASRQDFPSPSLYEEIFFKYYKDNYITTWRDEDHFRWRYVEAPYSEDLIYYISVKDDANILYLIARKYRTDNIIIIRILDLFGDIEDKAAVKDMLRLVSRDAVDMGASQITILVSDNLIKNIVLNSGFFLHTAARFCWIWSSGNQYQIDRNLNDIKFLWTLGDSDNDAI